MNQLNALYQRVCIEGYLKTQSDLHIGSGTTEEQVDGSKLNTFLRGDKGQPYIPASSIKGYLLSKAEKVWEEDETKKLFGFVTDDANTGTGNANNSGEQRAAAQLRVSDAMISVSDSKLITRYGIAIDPITGTADADKHALFRYEIIPIGSRIACRFEMDAIDRSSLEKMIQLLYHWNGDADSAMGAKIGQGYGRVKWHQTCVTGITKEQLKAWLTSNEPLQSFYQKLDMASTASTASIDKHHHSAKLEIILHTDAPIVIHDPQQLREPVDKQDHPPKITCSRTLDNKALIPGTSLKGLLRGWCRKILMTILQADYQQTLSEANKIADNFIGDLFGSTKMAGYIQLSDAISTQELKLHHRPMIAIDRFSGGVKGGQYLDKKHQQRDNREEKIEGALVNIEAAINAEYKADLSLNQNRITPQDDSWKGLLLLALRDAMQGDFVIGWGKTRGFGSFKLKLKINEKIYSDWDELYKECLTSASTSTLATATVQQLDAQASLNSLHDKLEALIQAQQSTQSTEAI